MRRRGISSDMDLGSRFADKLRHFITLPQEQGLKRAITLAVASNKGGVGKTTTCINLAVAYAQQGFDVLLVDLDPQAHVATSLRTYVTHHGHSLGDILLGRSKDLQPLATRWEHLFLAGSDKNLAEIEMILGTKIGKELILHNALEIARAHYDLILFDCPPNLGTLTLNALCAADKLLIPLDMSALALEGVGDILHAVETLRTRLGSPLEICGILATRFDKRAVQMNQAVEQSLFELYGRHLLETSIPQSSALNKAHMAGKPIFEFAVNSPGAKAYRALAKELLQHLQMPFSGEYPAHAMG